MTYGGGDYICPCCHWSSHSRRFQAPRAPMRVPAFSQLRIENVPLLPDSSWEYRLCRPCTITHRYPKKWKVSQRDPVPGPPHMDKLRVVLPLPPPPDQRSRPRRPVQPSALPRPTTRYAPPPPPAAPDGADEDSSPAVLMEIHPHPLQPLPMLLPPPPPHTPPPPPPHLPPSPSPLPHLPPSALSISTSSFHPCASEQTHGGERSPTLWVRFRLPP